MDWPHRQLPTVYMVMWKQHASFGSAIQNRRSLNITVHNRAISATRIYNLREFRWRYWLLFETNDNRHSFDVTYFARNVKNAISSEVINFTTYASRAVNLEGKSKVKGVEVALQR